VRILIAVIWDWNIYFDIDDMVCPSSITSSDSVLYYLSAVLCKPEMVDGVYSLFILALAPYFNVLYFEILLPIPAN
jgi:hypothetical protein